MNHRPVVREGGSGQAGGIISGVIGSGHRMRASRASSGAARGAQTTPAGVTRTGCSRATTAKCAAISSGLPCTVSPARQQIVRVHAMEEWLARRVAEASRQQPAVAALSLDERLDRAHRSRVRLAEAGPGIVDAAVREARMPRKFVERELESALLLMDALPEFAVALRPRRLPATSGTTVLEWRPYGVVLGLHSANSPIWVPTVVSMSALVAGNAVVCRPSSRVARTSTQVLAALGDAWPAGALAIATCDRAAVRSLLVAPGIDAIVAHASTGRARRTWQRSPPATPTAPCCGPTSRRPRATMH